MQGAVGTRTARIKRINTESFSNYEFLIFNS